MNNMFMSIIFSIVLGAFLSFYSDVDSKDGEDIWQESPHVLISSSRLCQTKKKGPSTPFLSV